MIGHSASRQLAARLAPPAGLLRRRLAATTTAPGPFRPIYAAQRAALASSTGSSVSAQQAADGAHSKRRLNASSVYEDTSERLPSLPVPNLGATLELLKATIWPIAMNSDEFAQALHLIEAFAGPAGQKLDLLLRAKASQTKNWLSHDWWLDETYLKSRKSLVINSNPALIYPKLPFEVSGQRQLIATCAQLVSSVIHCKLALQRGWNPERQEHEHEQQQLDSALCYDQYRRIFGSTRLPGEHADTFKPCEPREHELNFNLICSFRGQFFEIQFDDVSSEQGRVEALESVLSKIINGVSADSVQAAPGPGILTTLPRSLWARAIKLLEPDSLEAMERAHLVLNLDTIPSEPEDAYARALVREQPASGGGASSGEFMGALARQMLHGDRANVGNRWFDKSLQLIVVADESCSRLLGAGLNYEHCLGEAVVLTRLVEFSHAKLLEYQRQASCATSGSSAPDTVATFRRLQMGAAGAGDQFELGAFLQRARQDFNSQIDQFDLNYFDYRRYGREAVKAWHFSPDSWFQVALQLAHFQLHKRLAPCYESASTRQFAYGRTETIRSLTKDVGQFCLEPGAGSLRAAVESHKSYAQAANAGAAIDRVLLGYRLVFNELKANRWTWGLPTFATAGAERGQLKFNSLADMQREQQVQLHDLFSEKELNILGAFFNNQLFERAKRFSLSTSQVSSLAHPDICTSYGPLVPDGYACCYNLSARRMVAAITANSSNQSFSCETGRFGESLSDSLDRMRHIVEEQFSPNAANGSLNTYKPSTLLVDVSSNIDDNLGVRNLVKPAAANGKSQDDQSSGGGRARPALNEWSTNNGSVIYAPTEVVKSHFSKQAASSACESQQLSSTTAAHPKHLNLAKHAPGDGQLSANTANYLTLKPARHGKQLKSQPDPTSDSADAKTLNEESPSTASNWSNGTGTTSDLLF